MPKFKQNEDREAVEPIEIYEGCGNIFKDLGYSDTEAASRLLRSEFMLAVRDVIAERGWTQQEAAKQLGVHQPRISDLFQGRVSKFSLETLIDWLAKLGKKVVVTVQDRDVA
jgi:predicted XRE-type DNA-binding protein